jgi:hypothetical protein
MRPPLDGQASKTNRPFAGARERRGAGRQASPPGLWLPRPGFGRNDGPPGTRPGPPSVSSACAGATCPGRSCRIQHRIAVAGHRLKLGERGDQGGLRNHDPGAHGRSNGEPARRTLEAVTGLNRLPKQQLPLHDPQRAWMFMGHLRERHRSFACWAATGGGSCARVPARRQGRPGRGEPLVAIVEPDVLAEGDQGGEALRRQRAEEPVQMASGGGVADALL